MGSVVATCSGQRHQDEEDNLGQSDQISGWERADNSLKVWSMPFLASNTDVEHEDIESNKLQTHDGEE